MRCKGVRLIGVAAKSVSRRSSLIKPAMSSPCGDQAPSAQSSNSPGNAVLSASWFAGTDFQKPLLCQSQAEGRLGILRLHLQKTLNIKELGSSVKEARDLGSFGVEAGVVPTRKALL